MAFVKVLLCTGRGAGAADGSEDGAVAGSGVGAGVAELAGVAIGDGEGVGAATAAIVRAPPETFAASVPLASARAENAGLNARIAETRPAAIVCARMPNPRLSD
jgi:hypothetical protein